MVEYIYQPLKFFTKFNEKIADGICKYCIERKISMIIIENVAEEFKEKNDRKNENGYFTNTINNIQNKYKNIISNLEENITKYKQFFENRGLNTLYFTPKTPNVGKLLVREYGVKITTLLAFINAVIFLLYLPFDYFLRKLGKVKIADRLSDILTLPPLKESIACRNSALFKDIKKFAEEVEKRNGETVAVILLNRKV
jgi:hypothetical protein